MFNSEEVSSSLSDVISTSNGDSEMEDTFDNLPGSLNSDNSLIQQKIERMRMHAQRQTPRLSNGIVQSSRPLSARQSISSIQQFSSSPPEEVEKLGSSSSSSYSSSPITNISNPTATSTTTTTTTSHSKIPNPNLFSAFEDIETSPLPPTPRQNTIQNAETVPISYSPSAEVVIPSPIPPIPTLDISDRRLFCSRPCPKSAGLIRCYVERERTTLSRLFPRYFMYYEDKNQFLLSARKRKKNKSSNYLISLDRDDQSRGSDNYFGKLRSNFLGTEFIMYDQGSNPKKVGDTDPNARSQIGAIVYDLNFFGTKGPRKVTVLLPNLQADGKFQRIIETSDGSIIEKYKSDDFKDITVYKNKMPGWNEKLKAYVLDFAGRVSKASVKNFQLVDVNDATQTKYMQFGKVGTDKFTLDFRHPFSALQAFSIALSAFDIKIACE